MPAVSSASRVMCVYAPDPETSSSFWSGLPQRTRVRSVRCVPGVTYASMPIIGFTPWAWAADANSNAPNVLPWSVIAMAG